MSELPTRRTVLTTGIAAAGATAGTVVLAACGSGSGSPGSNGNGNGNGNGNAVPVGTTIAMLSDVPVGQCKSVKVGDQDAIVGRPDATSAVCFSAICTHQGCTVKPDGAQANCPCHGSEFNGLTGAVERGPATKPLPAIPVRVDGTNIIKA